MTREERDALQSEIDAYERDRRSAPQPIGRKLALAALVEPHFPDLSVGPLAGFLTTAMMKLALRAFCPEDKPMKFTVVDGHSEALEALEDAHRPEDADPDDHVGLPREVDEQYLADYALRVPYDLACEVLQRRMAKEAQTVARGRHIA